MTPAEGFNLLVSLISLSFQGEGRGNLVDSMGLLNTINNLAVQFNIPTFYAGMTYEVAISQLYTYGWSYLNDPVEWPDVIDEWRPEVTHGPTPTALPEASTGRTAWDRLDQDE